MAAEAQVYFDRGLAALEQADFHEALECLTRAINLQPRVAAGYRFRALAFRGLGDRPRAIADFDAAIRYKPQDPQLLVERAAELLKQRQYDAAIADCDLALSLDPGRVDLFVIRGRAHAARGDTPAAFADLDEAVRVDPDHAAEYRVQRAVLHRNLGQLEQAIDDCDAAIRLNPELPLAYEVRAQLHQDRHDHARSLADYQTLVKLEPDSREAWLGCMDAHLANQNAPAAREAANAILANHPQELRAIEGRARAEMLANRPAVALADCDILVARLGTRSASVFLFRGQVRLSAGDEAGAITDYQEGLTRDPRNSALWNALAWARATAGTPELQNPVAAIQAATRAVELAEEPLAAYHDTLAMAYASQGDWEQAIRWGESALTLDDQPVYREHLENSRQRKTRA